MAGFAVDGGRSATYILTKFSQATVVDIVNLYDAKTNLSRLVERAAAGEEIVIAKSGRPLARLVPFARRTAPRPLGLLEGEGWVGADFDDPLPEATARAFRGELP